MLGTIRIQKELGCGGMGIVFKGLDQELGRTVAVKILSGAIGDGKSRPRFVREAQVLAGLEHDHIVTIYKVDQAKAGNPYLVMQYVDGPTLRQRLLEEGRILPREAANIVLQVADGLASAHRLGLVHRDIKPANIMWDAKQSRAKIVDFGLVRIMEARETVTTENVVPGTPEYMSPEQIIEPNALDGRSDLFSLGATFYELLTGEVPFHGAILTILQQIVQKDPLPPRRLISSIPQDLETICLKAMAKKKNNRYQSAVEFADDVRRYLNHEPIRPGLSALEAGLSAGVVENLLLPDSWL